MKPFISIVTLNYNQAAVTCEFLESTRQLTYPRYEILVCDMCSREDPTDCINARHFPHTKALRSEVNLGFTGGNNWGMRQAKGDLFFIVNNDTEVTPDLLDKLVAPFLDDPAVGVTCPKIKFFQKRNIIQYAGFNRMNRFTGRATSVGNMEEDKGQHDKSGPTNGAHGCAMLVSREVVERVGMFPEKFFMYYEEWDWSARILKAGYKIWYAGDAEIYHKESMSIGKDNPMKAYYHTRNRILYMRRNTTFFQLTVFTAFFVFLTAPKSIFNYLRNKQYKHLKLFLKGAFWNLRTSSQSPV